MSFVSFRFTDSLSLSSLFIYHLPDHCLGSQLFARVPTGLLCVYERISRFLLCLFCIRRIPHTVLYLHVHGYSFEASSTPPSVTD